VTTIGTVPMSAFGGRINVERDQPFPRIEIENAVSDGLKFLVEAAEFADGRIDVTSLDIRVSTRGPRAGQLGDVLVISVEADVEVPL
jgi:hypothetical protein